MTKANTTNYSDKRVQNQYEALPYPPRDPQDENQRLQITGTDFLDLLNFYGFEGKQDFQDIRILVAGGGTGDSSIFLAEQLRNTDSTIIHLDMSAASIAIAKERAAIRGLTNITFIQDSLLNLPQMNLEPFDYINCIGVLHHLPNPQTGLDALAEVLKDDGAMAIMVYGLYGRTGVYQMQELMRLVNSTTSSIADEVENCKYILQSLPDSNWFCRGEDLHNDHQKMGDAGIYDLLLHKQDRAYTIPQFYDLLSNSSLTVRSLYALFGQARYIYNPASWCRNPSLLETFHNLPPQKQQAIAELMCGTMKTHTAFVSKRSHPAKLPNLADETLIPFFSAQVLIQIPGLNTEINSNIRSIADGSTFTLRTPQCSMKLEKTSLLPEILDNLDGQRSIGEIADAVVAIKANKAPIERRDAIKQIYDFYNKLNYADWMLLRQPNSWVQPSIQSLQQAMLAHKTTAA